MQCLCLTLGCSDGLSGLDADTGLEFIDWAREGAAKITESPKSAKKGSARIEEDSLRASAWVELGRKTTEGDLEIQREEGKVLSNPVERILGCADKGILGGRELEDGVDIA